MKNATSLEEGVESPNPSLGPIRKTFGQLADWSFVE